MNQPIRTVATLAVLAAACGASAPRVQTAPPGAPVAHESSAAPSPQPASHPETVTATIVPNLGSVFAVGHANEPYFVAGSMRIAAGREPHAAADRPATSIVRVVHAPRGWVFLAQDGAVFGSDSFDGPLHRLGEIARPNATRATSIREDGTAAFVDGQGALWLTDGHDEVHRIDTLGSGVIDAAFVDASHGIAASENGVLITSDGGSQWQPIETPVAVWSVEARRSTFAARSAAGAFTIAVNGIVTPGEPRANEPAPISPADRERILEIARDAVPASRLAYAAPLGDALVSIANHEAVVTDAATGHERHRTNTALPSGCALQSWGATVVAECEFHNQMHRSRDGQRFELVPWFTDSESHAFSDDGVHAAALHSCVQPGSAAGLDALCAFDASSSTARNIDLPGRALDIEQVRGGAAMVVYASDTARTAIARVDLDDGHVVPLRFADLPVPTTVLFAQFLADHEVLVGLGSLEGNARFLAVGDPRSPLRFQPLAIAAAHAAVLPSGAWLFTGDDAAHVWVSHDRAAHFEPITVNLDGDAADVSLRSASPRRDRLACNTLACTAGPLVIEWRASSSSARGTVFAAAHPAPVHEVHAEHPLVGWVCSLDTHSLPTIATPRSVPTRASHAPLDFPGGRVVLHTWDVDSHVHAVLAWRALDRSGTVREGSTRDDVWPDATPPTRIHAVTDAGMLFERCPTRGRCNVLWAPRRGRAIALDVTEPGANTNGMRVGWSVDRGDGGLVFSLALPVPDTYVEQVIEIDRSGRIVHRGGSAASGASARPQALVRHAGEYGIAIRARDDHAHWNFHPVARPDTSLALTLPDEVPLAACTRPTPRDADLWFGVLPSFASDTRFEDVENVWLNRVLVEVTPRGRCVRAVETGSALANPLIEVPADARPTRITSRHDGSFAGVLADPDEQHRVRCVRPIRRAGSSP